MTGAWNKDRSLFSVKYKQALRGQDYAAGAFHRSIQTAE